MSKGEVGGGGGGGGGERWGAELRYAARVVQSQEKIAEAGWRRGGLWPALVGCDVWNYKAALSLPPHTRRACV